MIFCCVSAGYIIEALTHVPTLCGVKRQQWRLKMLWSPFIAADPGVLLCSLGLATSCHVDKTMTQRSLLPCPNMALRRKITATCTLAWLGCNNNLNLKPHMGLADFLFFHRSGLTHTLTCGHLEYLPALHLSPVESREWSLSCLFCICPTFLCVSSAIVPAFSRIKMQSMDGFSIEKWYYSH